ncbi:hypothetical protein SFC65_20325 [Priestia filamentosa]|uniref:hypothetical protein n=1 Tax=Priestia filamentosa TaxID=1402861 RepID=UPI003982505A
MSKSALFEALPLKKTLERGIQELLQERDRIAYVEFEKNEKYETPKKTIDQVTEELEEARKDYRTLTVAMARANLEAKLEWDKRDLSITKALELAQQLRGEADKLKGYGKSNKQERVHSYSEVVTYRAALFEPEEMQKKALKLERVANRLSNLIEKTIPLLKLSL